MAVDFATFLNTVTHILDARLPVLLRGRHGVGKSQVVYQIAEQRALPVVERRASQMTEGDLLGLPDTADLSDGRKATTWNAPDWLVTACTQPVVLFLDEVDRATMEVLRSHYSLDVFESWKSGFSPTKPRERDSGVLEQSPGSVYSAFEPLSDEDSEYHSSVK